MTNKTKVVFTMTHYNEIADLAEAADDNGLAVVTLGNLREMLSYSRLGVRVLSSLSQALRSEGLGYYPLEVLDANEVPRQTQELRVYKVGSPVAQLIESVLYPDEDGDEFIMNASEGAASATVIDQIRTLIS